MNALLSPQQRLQIMTLKSQKAQTERQLAIQKQREVLTSPSRPLIQSIKSSSPTVRLDFQKKYQQVSQKEQQIRDQKQKQLAKKLEAESENYQTQKQLDQLALEQQHIMIQKTVRNANENRSQLQQRNEVNKQNLDNYHKVKIADDQQQRAAEILQQAQKLKQKTSNQQSKVKEYSNPKLQSDYSGLFSNNQSRYVMQKAETQRQKLKPRNAVQFEKQQLEMEEKAQELRDLYISAQLINVGEVQRQIDKSKLKAQENQDLFHKPDYLTKPALNQTQHSQPDNDKNIWLQIDQLKASSLDPKVKLQKIEQLIQMLSKQ